jgi:hypothetical protein
MAIVGYFRKMLFQLHWKIMPSQSRATVLSIRRLQLQEQHLRQFDLGRLR